MGNLSLITFEYHQNGGFNTRKTKHLICDLSLMWASFTAVNGTLVSAVPVPIVPIVRLSAPSPTLLRNWRKLGFILDSTSARRSVQISLDPSHSCPDGLALSHWQGRDEF